MKPEITAAPARGRANIQLHEGRKYLRKVYDVIGEKEMTQDVSDPSNDPKSVMIDVYEMLRAFDVTSQPIGHAIKKLLAAGARGKGDAKADLIGAIAAINRALDELELPEEDECQDE